MKTKAEVIEVLTHKGLLNAQRDGSEIDYVDGNQLYYDGSFHRRRNVYGVYYNAIYNIYVFFITGEERDGMMIYHRNFNTEDEAYTGMYDYINYFYNPKNK